MTSMSCTKRTACGRRQPLALAARAAGPVRRSWRAFWDWRARKATAIILRSLDCRTLHDIGIHPSEIDSLVYGGGGDRCRRYDATWPWRSGGM